MPSAGFVRCLFDVVHFRRPVHSHLFVSVGFYSPFPLLGMRHFHKLPGFLGVNTVKAFFSSLSSLSLSLSILSVEIMNPLPAPVAALCSMAFYGGNRSPLSLVLVSRCDDVTAAGRLSLAGGR